MTPQIAPIPTASGFKFKKFQKQDLARAAMHDGLIKSWDTGLGKTVAAFIWPLLKVGWTQSLDPETGETVTRPNEPILMVIPGDLHQQTINEGWEKFRIKVKPLESQDAFLRLTAHADMGNRSIPPDFYITSYTDLTTNGVNRIPDPMDHDDPRVLMQQFCLPVGEHKADASWQAIWSERPDFMTACEFFAWRHRCWANEFNIFTIDQTSTLTDLNVARKREIEAAQSVQDDELRSKKLVAIEEAYHVLKNLMCREPNPEFKWLAPVQQEFIIRHWLADKFDRYRNTEHARKRYIQNKEGEWRLGTDKDDPKEITNTLSIECVYSPSLADLSHAAFSAVVVDEGVKMKGEDTYVGLGVRKMNPKYRLVLTATPVKNRLPDIFRLAHWATGAHALPTARWPYREDSSARSEFAETFMVSERNLTKEAEAAEGKKAGGAATGRYKKLTAEVCNIHRLWKLFAPIVLRRRKDDAGEDIVKKVRRVVRCELGTLQNEIYEYHLRADYLDKNGDEAIGAQLQALRIAAADPSSTHLEDKGLVTRECQCTIRPKADTEGTVTEVNGEPVAEIDEYDHQPPAPNCPHCHGEGYIPLRHRSANPYIPKMASCLTIIEEVLARKEQVVVFSAFNDPLDSLGKWLDESSVPYCKLDGRVSQKKRGRLANLFKQGREVCEADGGPRASVPVMLAGVECMAEGHSFHRANNVILIAYSWAYDKFIQAINRVHRMTSLKDVNVYVIVCHGTIDRRLESLIQEKGDSAELVLDGRLMGERPEEINLAALLKIAHQEFAAAGQQKSETIDEAALHAQWPALRDKLKAAIQSWYPETAAVPTPNLQLQTTKKSMRRTTPMKIKKPTPPTHDVQTPALEQAPRIVGVGQTCPSASGPAQAGTESIPDTTSVPEIPPASDWRAKLRARVAAITAKPITDAWKQL